MTFLNTSISSLLAAQRGLQTVSHNIANVDTPGFSRQRVEVSAREPEFQGVGFVGRGVQVDAINRVHNEFITEQVRISTSSASANETFLSFASRVDNLLANEETGLSTNLSNFFNAVQDVADLPSSINNRQVLVGEADSLVARFQFLQQRLDGIGNEVRDQLNSSIGEVNTLTNAIADINNRIVSASGNSDSQAPNDLLDQRDEFLRQLSEYVSVNTVEQANGAVNVFTGNGQALVLNSTPSTFQLTEPYQGRFDISVNNSFGSAIITDNINSGILGGLIDFQNNLLEPNVNSLGRLAINLADSFNQQHALGVNLDGEVNTAFFNVATPEVIGLGTAPNNVAATITSPNELTNSDYRLTFDGANQYSLVRLSDNTTTTINTGGAAPFTTTNIDGFTLTLSAAPTVGDQYIIRPTVFGARDITSNISDPRKVAAAGALTAQEATNANGLSSNTGTAVISDIQINSTTDIPLAAPITLTFNESLNQFIVSAPPSGVLAYNPATQSNGVTFNLVIGDGTFNISGIPNDGDQFVINNTTDASGDNRNALLLGQLQDENITLNSTANFQDAFGQIVVEVGASTRQAEVTGTALSSLLEQATEARENFSGVNLDEEAANLIELQQLFQASAQLIATADQLFQTLIDSV